MSTHAHATDPGVSARRPRALLLLAVGLNVLLIAGRALSFPSLWTQPDALTYVLEPLVLLLIYAAITLWVTRNMTSNRRHTLFHASIMGLFTGALWIVNLALETFADLSRLGLAATAPFLLGGFVLWGVTGYRTASLTASMSSGTLAALWSAMICILMTIAFGLLLTYTSLPRLEHDLVTDPDFLRSHWHNLRAFAIANSFDSAFSHLLGGLFVGTIAGMGGSLLGLLTGKTMSIPPPPAG